MIDKNKVISYLKNNNVIPKGKGYTLRDKNKVSLILKKDGIIIGYLIKKNIAMPPKIKPAIKGKEYNLYLDKDKITKQSHS